MPLSTASNFAKPDDAFRAIVEAHRVAKRRMLDASQQQQQQQQ